MGIGFGLKKYWVFGFGFWVFTENSNPNPKFTQSLCLIILYDFYMCLKYNNIYNINQ